MPKESLGAIRVGRPAGAFLLPGTARYIDELNCLCYNEYMNRPHSHEHTPHFIEIDGDVRHPDDDVQGFDAEGFTPKESSFSTDESIKISEEYEELADADELPLAINIDYYREQQYLARKSFAKAHRNAGLEKRLAHESDTRDLRPIEDKRREYMRVGDEHFKRAFGYEAMKAVAVAEGMDIEEFEHQFLMARNDLIRTNQGREGDFRRRRLRRMIREGNSPTKHDID